MGFFTALLTTNSILLLAWVVGEREKKIKNNILYLWVIIIVKKAGIDPAFLFYF